VIGFILCRTKSFVCKDALHRESTIQKHFRRFCLQVKRFSVPCQPSGRPCHPVRMLICPLFHPFERRDILSGPPTDQASSIRTMWISVRTLHCIEKLLFQLASVRTPFNVFDRASDSFQVHIWEDCCNRPDDVDSHPDALLLKARIVIQIQPSGRLSAWSGRGCI
jgi:hypothetical protein